MEYTGIPHLIYVQLSHALHCFQETGLTEIRHVIHRQHFSRIRVDDLLVPLTLTSVFETTQKRDKRSMCCSTGKRSPRAAVILGLSVEHHRTCSSCAHAQQMDSHYAPWGGARYSELSSDSKRIVHTRAILCRLAH